MGWRWREGAGMGMGMGSLGVSAIGLFELGDLDEMLRDLDDLEPYRLDRPCRLPVIECFPLIDCAPDGLYATC